MLASLHLIKYTPPRRTKEEIAQDEYECPLCGCITSMFAPACLECGAAFDEEEMDEAIRQQFAAEGDAVLLAFYDARLGEKPENADLLYARGLLLQTMGRTDEAMASLDRAAARSEEHTSELQSLAYLVCRLLLEKKKNMSLKSRSAKYAEPDTSSLSL